MQAAYEASLMPARTVPTGWTGSTATCTKGTESQASIDATRSAVNFYRALNRLAPVTMSASYNGKALAAALNMQANGRLDHYPAATSLCYSADAYAGASSSNLAGGVTGAKAIDGYLVEPGAGNEVAGHRRWVLNPAATTFGTGSTTNFNALWVVGVNGTRPSGVDLVAWPSPGYVPKAIVPTLFSASSNRYPDADWSKATVTVKVGATSLPVTVYPTDTGYGDNALTWRVTLPADFATSATEVPFDIAISGAKTAAGAAIAPYRYRSTAYVEAVAPTAPDAPTAATATAGNGQATVSWTAPAGNGGTPITGYQITPYAGAVALPTRTFASTATTQVISGLANGTSYTFVVAAVNAAGVGSPSAASKAVVPAAPAYAPFASAGAMVDRFFLDLTAVAPTTAERTTWVTALGNRSKTAGDLVEALRRGTDNTTNVDPAARLYRAFLGRTPDAGGLTFWVGRRRTGTWTLTRMADSFASSSEFTRKYGSLTNREFVTRIYTDVLGRAADKGGVDYWTAQLDSGRRTRGAVMVGFSESNEYKTKQANNTDVAVTTIFLLGRAPSADEVAAWTVARTQGTTAAVLAQQLVSSAEYARRIAA